MSQPDLSLSRPTDLVKFQEAVGTLLEEKKQQYGVAGGFYLTNKKDYTHALGEAQLKLKEYEATGNQRCLLKAVGWIYLIWEQENHGPRRD
jgi:hypothetical protein